MRLVLKEEYNNKRVTLKNIIELYKILLKYYDEDKAKSFYKLSYEIVFDEDKKLIGEKIDDFKKILSDIDRPIESIRLYLYTSSVGVSILMPEKISVFPKPLYLEVKGDKEKGEVIFAELKTMILGFNKNFLISKDSDALVILYCIALILLSVVSYFLLHDYTYIAAYTAPIIWITLLNKISRCHTNIEFELYDGYNSKGKKLRLKYISYIKFIVSLLAVIGTIITIYSAVNN